MAQARFLEATHRTTRWLDRCIAAHSRPTEQNLFAIIQGGIDPVLREISLEVPALLCPKNSNIAEGGGGGTNRGTVFLRAVIYN